MQHGKWTRLTLCVNFFVINCIFQALWYQGLFGTSYGMFSLRYQILHTMLVFTEAETEAMHCTPDGVYYNVTYSSACMVISMKLTP